MGNSLSRTARFGFIATVLLLALFRPAWGYVAADFYPLAPGNSWTYAVVDDGVSSTETDTVSANKVLFNGTYAYEIVSSDGTRGYSLNDQNGVREFGGIIPGVFVSGYGTTTATGTFSPPRLVAPAEFVVGQSQSSSGQLSYLYQGVGTVAGPYSSSTTAMGFETVTVPAGMFNAVKMSGSLTFNGTSSTNGASVSVTVNSTSWLAENIGPVKTITTGSDGTSRTEELISYSLPQASTTTTSTTASTTTTTQAPSASVSIEPGWNLVGNGSSSPMDVLTQFNDATRITSAWKWSNGKWAFYAPSMTSQALADYAASKGYEVLTTINGGDGFWINASQSLSVTMPEGTPVRPASFQEGKTGALKPGWNLVAIGISRTPPGFNGDLGTSPPTPEVVPINLTTLWAWDNPKTKWYFYAPSLDAQGGTALTDYIAGKGYLDFTTANKTLGPGVGFWVNRP